MPTDPQTILGPLGWVGTLACVATFGVLLANPRIRAIARLTLLDSIRRMEFQAVLLFGLVLMVGMGYLLFVPGILDSPLWGVAISHLGTTGAEGVNVDPQAEFIANFPNYLRSAMLLFAEIFTLFITFALTLFLISGDIAQGFLLTLLPKPLTRGEYLWGRGLGVIATICAAWVTMGLVIFLAFALRTPAVFSDTSRGEWMILAATGLGCLKWVSVVAILFYATLRMPPVVGGFLALCWFFAGHLAVFLWNLGTDETLGGLWRAIAWSLYVTLPHYDRVFSANILDPAVNQFQLPVDYASFIGWAWLYSMVCALGCYRLFRQRDL